MAWTDKLTRNRAAKLRGRPLNCAIADAFGALFSDLDPTATPDPTPDVSP